MSKSRSKQKVVKMRQKPRLFAGMLLLLLSIYAVIIFIQSITKSRVSIYEVTQTQIADDETVTGIILRDETLVRTNKAGYINYYIGEGARVGCKTTIYSVDETGRFADEFSSLDSGKIELSDEDTREIRSDIANYRDEFSLSEYSKVTNFKYSIDNTLLQMTTVSMLDKLNQLMKKDSSSLELVKAKKTGIISFCSDGKENLTIDNISADIFKDTSDNWEQLRKAESVKKGSAVYKLIQSEKWSVVVPLTNKQYKKIYDKASVPVVVKKDNMKLYPNVSTFTVDSNYYARLDFNKYMIRYLDNRYLDIEIEFDNASGLKIPVSSIIKKKFYVIPKEYITKGGEHGDTGIMLLTYKKNGEQETTFKPASVFYEDEDGKAYIDASLFEPGSTIVKGTSKGTSSIQLDTIKKFEGVYNCNQGYCEFRRIEKLYANDEYAIISNSTDYGLSTYDHIVLNPELINENDII